MRSFDPRSVGTLECRAWETYYQRRWATFLLASVGLVRAAFRMPWPATLRGAWLILRANQKWAPSPVNDPEAARRFMAGFYRLLADHEPQAGIDPRRAAEIEVEWWRVHRADVSDAWVDRGSSSDDPDLARERALLVRSYAALLTAVHR
jgi:hypothetical protein